MAIVRTFVDSCLLLMAARGADDLAERALSILDDPERQYVTSDFVALEILPKAVYHGQVTEAEFYRTFLDAADETIHSSRDLVIEAQFEAEQVGLSAIDALHVAAARQGNCDELVTAEKPTKPLFRVHGLTVTTVRDY